MVPSLRSMLKDNRHSTFYRKHLSGVASAPYRNSGVVTTDIYASCQRLKSVIHFQREAYSEHSSLVLRSVRTNWRVFRQ